MYNGISVSGFDLGRKLNGWDYAEKSNRIIGDVALVGASAEMITNSATGAAEGEAAAPKYGSTPEGRPLTKHYGTETGPERNIPGSVVDNTINMAPGVPGRNGTTVHYDPANNVTVVTGNGGSIVS